MGDKKKKKKKKEKKPASQPQEPVKVQEVSGPWVCEACEKAISIVYCIDCDHLYCEKCTTVTHEMKFNANHTTLPKESAANYRVKCKKHESNRITSFCKTCKTPVCLSCRSDGHHGPGHPCINIGLAYQENKNHLQKCINNQLKPKKEEYLIQLQILQDKVNEIGAVEVIIENEIRDEYDMLLQNLKDQKSEKVGIVHVDMDNMKNQLSEMTSFEDKIRNYENEPKGLIEFLNNFNQLESYIERESNKKVKHEIKVNAEFKNEIKLRKEILGQHNGLVQKLQESEQDVERLSSEQSKLKQHIKNLNQDMKNEIEQWMTYKFLFF